MEDHFEYLDTLRETGATNMLGAGKWLEDAFLLDPKAAREVLGLWMKTFDGESPVNVRVARAQGEA